jgi:VanZ family protein
MTEAVERRRGEPGGSCGRSSDEPPGASRRPPAWRFALHFAAFLAVLVLWTWKLLDPAPVPGEWKSWLVSLGLVFAAAKGLHVVGYATLTVLAVTLPVPRRWRVFLVGLLVLHGVVTEVGQTFVPDRTGSPLDVLIDWAGIVLGVLAVHTLWKRR